MTEPTRFQRDTCADCQRPVGQYHAADCSNADGHDDRSVVPIDCFPPYVRTVSKSAPTMTEPTPTPPPADAAAVQVLESFALWVEAKDQRERQGHWLAFKGWLNLSRILKINQHIRHLQAELAALQDELRAVTVQKNVAVLDANTLRAQLDAAVAADRKDRR